MEPGCFCKLLCQVLKEWDVLFLILHDSTSVPNLSLFCGVIATGMVQGYSV